MTTRAESGDIRAMPRADLGRYEVLARIGTGGTANVFLAKSRGAAGFHKMVCLKALRPELAGDPTFVAMFLDEARLAARLRHPNCVEIYDLGHASGIYFLSMEYLLGESLRTLMQLSVRERPIFRPQHLAFIVAAACDGLHHAHELCDATGKSYGLVHRDVSPRNIMVTADGYTKVVDFGIAKTSANRAHTAAGSVKGKPSYMSPEQITGQKVDRRSDVFSLGIVLFEAISLRRLFIGEAITEIAQLILSAKIPRLRDVDPKAPRELDMICAKALSRDPDKRFQTTREMAAALREFLERAWPSQGTTELSRTLEEYLGHELRARQNACDLLLIETDKDEQHLRVLGAEPVNASDLLQLAPAVPPTIPPHFDEDSLAQTQIEGTESVDPPPKRAASGGSVATQIDTIRMPDIATDREVAGLVGVTGVADVVVSVREDRGTDPRVMPAWARVPSLEIDLSATDSEIRGLDKTKSLAEVTDAEGDEEDSGGKWWRRAAFALVTLSVLGGAAAYYYFSVVAGR